LLLWLGEVSERYRSPISASHYSGIALRMLDILIQNGVVIEGTGKRAFRADVAITAGRIARVAEGIEDERATPAAKPIHAPGRADDAPARNGTLQFHFRLVHSLAAQPAPFISTRAVSMVRRKRIGGPDAYFVARPGVEAKRLRPISIRIDSGNWCSLKYEIR